MCTVLLPQGVNQIAVNKSIYLSMYLRVLYKHYTVIIVPVTTGHVMDLECLWAYLTH